MNNLRQGDRYVQTQTDGERQYRRAGNAAGKEQAAPGVLSSFAYPVNATRRYQQTDGQQHDNEAHASSSRSDAGRLSKRSLNALWYWSPSKTWAPSMGRLDLLG
jgi:hypothetical protein